MLKNCAALRRNAPLCGAMRRRARKKRWFIAALFFSSGSDLMMNDSVIVE